MMRNIVLVLGGVLLLALLWTLPIAAQRQNAPAAPLDVTPAQIGFALKSGGIAWMDSLTPCATLPEDALGPRAMWMAIAVTNNATETLTGVEAELSGFLSAYYALTADSVRYVGNLAPGETYHGYWYVDYSGACQAGSPYSLSDLYTLTVTANNLSAPASHTGNLVTGSSGSVGAGDIITAFLSSNDLAIGQIFTQVAHYKLTRGSGVLIQPTGDADFEDACFRLVDVEVTKSDVAGILAEMRHDLYFPGANPKNNDELTVQYFWQAQCQSESVSTPWWTTTGSAPPPKYSDKYGVLFSTFPTASLSLNFTVSVTPTLLTSAGRVTYTVRLRNNFAEPIVANGARFGLPAHVVYKGVATSSAIYSGNSSQYPALDATGVLTWTGVPLLSYTVPASGTVTPGEPGTLDLIFTADAPAISGRYTAVTSATVGALDVGPFTVTFDVNLPTAVTLSAFDAVAQDGAVLVTWETALELDNVGFNLYRSESAHGPYMRLNAALIPPQFPGEVMGGFYEWLDTDVLSDVVYYYKLEDIDVKGARMMHGPVSTAAVMEPAAVRVRRFTARTTTPIVLGLPALLLAVIFRGRGFEHKRRR